MEKLRGRGARWAVPSSAIAALAITFIAASAHAQATAQPDSQPSASRAEAEQRYKRALELFNEGTYDAALLELRRAYELAPSYRILYNIALVNVQLADYAAALDAFERYLADGGTEVPNSRIEEVKSAMDRLLPRVASVEISVNVEGAEISVDDLQVAKSPLRKPLRVNAGRRRLSIAANGHLPESRVVELAGGDLTKVDFVLETPKPNEPVAAARPTGSAPVAPPAPATQASRPSVLVPWVITGVLAGTAAVTGVLALQAHSKQGDLYNQLGVTRAELDDQQSRVKRYALITDIVSGAALVSAGIAIYFTVSPSRGESAPAVAFRVSPTRLDARFAF